MKALKDFSGTSQAGTHPIGTSEECTMWEVALTEAEIALLVKGHPPKSVRPEAIVTNGFTIGNKEVD